MKYFMKYFRAKNFMKFITRYNKTTLTTCANYSGEQLYFEVSKSVLNLYSAAPHCATPLMR